MHRAPGIEVSLCWQDGNDDAPALGLHHVIAEGLRDGVERQRSAGEALDEFQSAHRFLLVGTNRPVGLGGHVSPFGALNVDNAEDAYRCSGGESHPKPDLRCLRAADALGYSERVRA